VSAQTERNIKRKEENQMKQYTILTPLATMTLLLTLSSSTLIALAAGGTTERVNVGGAGTEADNASDYPVLTPDGRFVVFESNASNLVPVDTNGTMDIFVRDLQNGTIERVNLTNLGVQAYQWSSAPDISDDGRFVAFESPAYNLRKDQPGGYRNIFVRDRQNASTQLITLGAEENSSSLKPAISGDGRYVAFLSDATNLVPNRTTVKQDVFVYDRLTGTTELVSMNNASEEANGDNYLPAISSDGRYVAFMSWASNLVPGDSNDSFDIFVRDRQLGTTELITMDSAGMAANSHSTEPALSADGRFVSFTSGASNLVAGDTNDQVEVFVRDRQTGTTELISVASGGTLANNYSYFATLSADGRFVSFTSGASNLVAGDTNDQVDVFVHDRQHGTTTRVSVDSAGNQGNGPSGSDTPATLNANGQLIAFDSYTTNLVTGDTNDQLDIFVHRISPEPGMAP
jgi:Tol biopolymer transport system component